jgi:4,5-DOPA dioxygenase extradiol
MREPLPTFFVSHGSPMTAVDPGPAGAAWSALARAVPVPRAILVVSAHWETELPMLTGSPAPATIHDFGGFPDVLYTLRYPAPGAPDVAEEVAVALKHAGITAGIDGCRGLDHGAWVPLMHMYPAANVPVLQLSVQPARGARHHLALGEALAELPSNGVLVVGSGHATHNLRDWMMHRRAPSPLPYVAAFADWLAQRLADDDREALAHWHERAPAAERAHPSDEHFLPVLVALAAAGPQPRVTRVHRDVVDGALAMDAYRFDPASGAPLVAGTGT